MKKFSLVVLFCLFSHNIFAFPRGDLLRAKCEDMVTKQIQFLYSEIKKSKAESKDKFSLYFELKPGITLTPVEVIENSALLITPVKTEVKSSFSILGTLNFANPLSFIGIKNLGFSVGLGYENDKFGLVYNESTLDNNTTELTKDLSINNFLIIPSISYDIFDVHDKPILKVTGGGDIKVKTGGNSDGTDISYKGFRVNLKIGISGGYNFSENVGLIGNIGYSGVIDNNVVKESNSFTEINTKNLSFAFGLRYILL